MKIRFTFILLIAVLISSCGYGIHGRLPFGSVKMGRIENRTFEHGLEDRLSRALSDELMKNGLKVSDKSQYSITGSIDKFELRGIAQKGDITVQYEVYIEGKFFLTGPDGKPEILKSSSGFPITFATEGALEAVTALKEEASVRALKDMAAEIVSSIMFR